MVRQTALAERESEIRALHERDRGRPLAMAIRRQRDSGALRRGRQCANIIDAEQRKITVNHQQRPGDSFAQRRQFGIEPAAKIAPPEPI